MLLQEAETDLLECKIDTIVLEDVDADTLPQLQEYMDTYASQNEEKPVLFVTSSMDSGD